MNFVLDSHVIVCGLVDVIRVRVEGYKFCGGVVFYG